MPSSKGQYVRIETQGRRTGRSHQVLVRYITTDSKVVIFPENVLRKDWVANVLSNPEIRLHTEQGIFEGSATLKQVKGLGDPLLKIFTRKYGIQPVKERYWGQLRYVEVELSGAPNPVDFYELIYGDLEAAFDGVAEDYDQHIFGNPMNVWLRDVSVGVMKELFKPGEVVLEIGCGTGTETLRLAAEGVMVLASDISSKMLMVLERKAKARGLSDNVIPIHSRPYQLRGRLASLGFRELDGAYSTYGAINTEPKLKTLFQDLHGLLRPEGTFVAGVWNKYYLYEIFGYTLRMKPSLALARLRNPVPVGRSRFCVSTNSYSVRSLSRLLGRYFKLRHVYGVEIFLPPSNLTRYLPPEPLLDLVKRLDLVLGRHFPWNRLGDHFLAVYTKIAS